MKWTAKNALADAKAMQQSLQAAFLTIINYIHKR
jgi:hypothetical protein